MSGAVCIAEEDEDQNKGETRRRRTSDKRWAASVEREREWKKAHLGSAVLIVVTRNEQRIKQKIIFWALN